jgi:hypothetical protein
MTATRWEYASVLWSDTVRKITKVDPEYERLSSEIQVEWIEKKWTYYPWREQAYRIWLPGADKADVRHAWAPDDTDFRTNLLEILNELGADGWEVVSHLVRASAMGSSRGRDTAGFPTEQHTLLKRPVG